MPKSTECVVSHEESNIRPIIAYRWFELQNLPDVLPPLETYLSVKFPWLTAEVWKKRIENQQIFLQPKPSQKQHTQPLSQQHNLRNGDRLWIPIFHIPEPVQEEALMQPYELIEDDGDLFVISKKAGVMSHAGGRYHQSVLRQSLKKNGHSDVFFTHRLDRDTSGCLIGARSVETRKEWSQYFEDQKVIKLYLAFTKSSLLRHPGETHSVSGLIGPDPHSTIRMKQKVGLETGDWSKSDFYVLSTFEEYTLWICRIYTGKRHQIRAHLANLGEWIIGDKIYFPDREDLFLKWHETKTLTDEEWALLEWPYHLLHCLSIQGPKENHKIWIAPIPKTWFNLHPLKECLKRASLESSALDLNTLQHYLIRMSIK